MAYISTTHNAVQLVKHVQRSQITICAVVFFELDGKITMWIDYLPLLLYSTDGSVCWSWLHRLKSSVQWQIKQLGWGPHTISDVVPSFIYLWTDVSGGRLEAKATLEALNFVLHTIFQSGYCRFGFRHVMTEKR